MYKKMGTIFIVFGALLLNSACGNSADRCTRDLDCGTEHICLEGICVNESAIDALSSEVDSGNITHIDVDITETDSGTHVDVDIANNTDSGSNTYSGSNTDHNNVEEHDEIFQVTSHNSGYVSIRNTPCYERF